MKNTDKTTDAPDNAGIEDPLAGSDTSDADEPNSRTRRGFLSGSAKKLGYAAPIVLLFRPRAACASGTTQLTPPP